MRKFTDKANILCILTLIAISILVFCTNMTGYPYIDTDETRFVSIAKDMLNNNEWLSVKFADKNIFDLSPLYFWLVNLSCIIFGKISPETVRLPISLVAVIGVISLYCSLNTILTRTYAMIVSLMFTSSLGILVFSRLATNDILFSAFAMISVLIGYLMILSKKNTTKYLFLMYLFCALSVLTGGLFGLIPLLIIIAMHIFSGDLKELIKPKNLCIGISVFLVLVLPWYIYMTIKYGLSFLKEFFGAYSLIKYSGMKQMLEMLVLFLLGFSPWIFSFLWILGYRIKDIYNSVASYFKENSQEKLKEKWKKLKKTDKFLSLNTIVFFIGFIFALFLGEKYTFLILFLLFPAACISGHYWYEYIVKEKHRKSIFFATIIPNLLFIICSLIGLFGHNVLNRWLFQGLNHLLIPLIIIFFVIPVIGIFAVIVKSRKVPFLANVILMISLSFVITPSIFNFMSLNGGENDLISFATKARNDNAPITAYISSKKYSLVYYYDKPVTFKNELNIQEFQKYLKENPNTYVVVEIKDIFTIDENGTNYELLGTGKRYCLIKYSENGQ